MLRFFRNTIYRVVCASAFIICLSCENDLAAVKAFATKEHTRYDIADSLRMVYSENGQARAVVTASMIMRWNPPEKKTEFLNGMEVRFFQNGKEVSVLRANYGVRDDNTNEMKVSGNVRMENNKGEVLETEDMVWDEVNKRIRADGNLSIRTPTEVAYGTGLDSDEDFANYTITRIRGIFSIDDDKGFRQ
jgi:LPS export ABC transporter protein LptC